VLLLSPWSGALADRVDRKRLVIGAQTAAALLSGGLAALAWAGRADQWVVIGFSAALGVVTAVSSPSQFALIASLVEDEDVPQAVALNSMTFNLARAVGPATAAAIVATLGIPWAFALNGLSYVALIAGLLASRPREEQRAERPSLRESLALLRDDPRLLAALAIVMVAGFGSDPVNTESPAFAHAYGRTDTWAGAIVAFFGGGAVAAALLFAGRVAGSRGRMALTLAALGGGIALFALAPWLPLGLAFLVVAGFGYLSSNTAATTRLQLGVAPHQRGRIMALWSVAFLGLRPVASLTDGAVAGAFGVRAAGVTLAVPALAAAAAVGLVLRRPSRRPR